MMKGCSGLLLLSLLLLLAYNNLLLRVCNAEPWPACKLPANSAAAGGQTLDKLSFLEVAAQDLGCRLSFATSKYAILPAVTQLHSNAVITGMHGAARRQQLLLQPQRQRISSVWTFVA
jgi:hypothetical protein